MTDVFAEIDEVMRQEKLAKFWDDNATLIITVIVLSITLTAGISGYKSWNQSKKEKQTSLYLELIETDDFNIASTQADKEMRPALETLFQFNHAESELEKGNIQSAFTLYSSIAKNAQNPRDFREIASLMAHRIAPDQSEFLTALEQISKNPESPWRLHAMTDLAIMHYHADQKDLALQYLEQAEQFSSENPELETTIQNLKKLYATQ